MKGNRVWVLLIHLSLDEVYDLLISTHMYLMPLLEIAKKRAYGSSTAASRGPSIEELAMHRSLSEFLFQTFAKPNTVDAVRKGMIDSAIAAQQKNDL
jgi:hypothetical protein